jgi:replicative DNA helicase
MEFKKGVHYSGDLEGAILGACLIEKEAFGRTFGLIEKEHFYYTGNKIVYTALAQMYNEGLMIDLITVFDYIQNVNKIDSINGVNIPYYISKLTTSVVSSAHIEYHSFIIKRMWMERELMSLTHGGTILDGEIPDQIYQLTKAIEKINTGQFQKEWFDMKDVMMQLAKHQEF